MNSFCNPFTSPHSRAALLAIGSFALLFSSISSIALPYPDRSPTNVIRASDGQDGDQFGTSVAISGDILLAGAPKKDGTGVVYIFDVTTGEELGTLTADDSESGDDFGQHIAVLGTNVLVGAPSATQSGFECGAAYLFDLTTKTQLHKFEPSDPDDGDRFGSSLSLDETVALIGAYTKNRDDLIFGEDAGSAYLFDLTTGDELFNLTPESQFEGSHFGECTRLSGNLAIVSAPALFSGAPGTVYIFSKATGGLIHTITRELDEDPYGLLGFGLGIEVLPAGLFVSRFSFGYPLDKLGYLYDLETGDEIDPPEAPGNNMGLLTYTYRSSQSASEGNIVASGAYSFDLDGLTVPLVWDLDSGEPIDVFPSRYFSGSYRFGYAIALAGDYFAVSDPFASDVGEHQGAVHVFSLSTPRPDAVIGNSPGNGVGQELVRRTTEDQTLFKRSKTLRRVDFYITCRNTGEQAADFEVTGSPGNRYFRAKYFDSDGKNITGGIIAGTHLEESVAAEEMDRSVRLNVGPVKNKLRKKIIRKKKRNRIRILKRWLVGKVKIVPTEAPWRSDSVSFQVRSG